MFTIWSNDPEILILPLSIPSQIVGSTASRICLKEIRNCSAEEGFSPNAEDVLSSEVGSKKLWVNSPYPSISRLRTITL